MRCTSSLTLESDAIERIRDHIKKAPPRKDRFDLNHAIDEVIALGRSAITRNGVVVQTLLAEEPRGAVFQFTLPDAEKEIMDSCPAALHTRERYEDSASDDHHPLAHEDNKRPHRSRRVPDQRRWGGQ